jgi:integrase
MHGDVPTPQTKRIPAYRCHRASGQAVVTLNGIDHYLGPHGTTASKVEYDRLTAEWLAGGRRLGVRSGNQAEMLVKELILGYWGHVAATTPSESEHAKVRASLKVLRELYGETKVSAFSSLAFKAVRLKMIESGLCISTIRQRMGVVRRMVAWAVENEMAPADCLQRIEAVSGLRAGRDGVKPQRKVQPVSAEHIQAVLPHVSPTIGAMVELQALTGARPGEVCRMTTGQIDRSGDIWLYRPTKHKTVDLGKDRTIPLGPKAQEVLKPWLKADPDTPLFSPIEAMEHEYAKRGRNGERARKPNAAEPQPKRSAARAQRPLRDSQLLM